MGAMTSEEVSNNGAMRTTRLGRPWRTLLRGRRESAGLHLDPETDAALKATAGEFAQAVNALLSAHLAVVRRRRVPVNRVSAAPATHLARVRFADGTTVLVQGLRPGGASDLAAGVITSGPVCLARVTARENQLVLTFDLGGRRRAQLLAVGMDQSD